MSDGAWRREIRGDIQGLRALAVLTVIAAHAGVPFLPGGFVGVDVFFVISGYLISGLLFREVLGTGRVSLGRLLRPAGPADPARGHRWSPSSRWSRRWSC